MAASSEEIGMGNNVYFDDDGERIPAEAEGSVLMAMGAAEGSGSALRNDENDGAERTGSDADGGDPLVLEQYHEDEDTFEAKRLESLKWLSSAAVDAATAAPKVGEPVRGMSCGVAVSPPPATTTATVPTPVLAGRVDDDDDNEVEEEVEGDGMGLPSYSREATADEEPWVLERIMNRRIFKNKAAGSAREVQYLCKWKYYLEPTWEGRTLLEDEGFKGDCDAYDGVRSAQAGGQQKGRGRASIYSGIDHAMDIDERPPLELVLSGADVTCLVRTRMAATAPDMWPLYYMSVVVPSRAEAFLKKWKALSATHRPELLFHGTRSQNVFSIVHNGLVVPGTMGVKVAHGKSFGIGIYTAKSADVSAGYTNYRNESYGTQTGEMFVCLGLVSNCDPNIRLAYRGEYVIFFDSSYVIPLGLVGFACDYNQTGQCKKMASNEPIPRVLFNNFFDPDADIDINDFKRLGSKPTQTNPALVRMKLPKDYRSKGGLRMTKRTMKECPRWIKDLYRVGGIGQHKSD